MVVRRFLAIFYPAAEFLITTRITRVEGEPFKSEGKVLVKAGWLEVYGREAADAGEGGNQLVPVQAGERVETKEIEVKQTQTKPAPRFSEATLLGAMEGAGKLVEDEELREAMAERGLGTPATRAQIIENLIAEEYVHRTNNELQPTGKAFMLLALLRGLSIQELSKPELTGEWEFKLKQMEHGRLSRPEFMKEIADMTRHIIERAKAYPGDEVPGDFGDLETPCPRCGGVIKENYRRFQCQKCDFSLPTFLSSRFMEPAEVERLIREKQLGPLQGFRSRQGRPFAAIIRLNAEHKLEFDFGNQPKEGEEGGAQPVDFTGKEPLGKCPKCGSRVFDNGMNYTCEQAVGKERKCDFRVGSIILQQPIATAQLQKLLADGKTDLLDKFISKRNGRTFKAFLVLGKDGKVGFEFEKREKKPAKDGKKEPKVKIDFTGLEPVGKCPRCGGRVFESEKDYLCENSQADKKQCKFKTGKTILQRPIEREQVAKLLAGGKTDLLEKFISKTGRPFSAWLVLDDMGKVTFEFPPRESDSAEAN
jgi:DNA topoisomerase-3